MYPANLTGLPLIADGGNVQARAASSAACRSSIGPSELVTQILPFSSTIANTRTVPITLRDFAFGGYVGVTRLLSRPLSEPVLISCGSAADGDGCGAGVVVAVATPLLGDAYPSEGFAGVNGLGILEVSA